MLAEGSIVLDAPVRDALSGSLNYSTQINRLFGGTYLTVEDVLAELGTLAISS